MNCFLSGDWSSVLRALRRGLLALRLGHWMRPWARHSVGRLHAQEQAERFVRLQRDLRDVIAWSSHASSMPPRSRKLWKSKVHILWYPLYKPPQLVFLGQFRL